MWLLPEDAPLRVRLYDAATSRGFDRLMSLCVLLNCAVMAYEHPGLDKRSVGGHIVYWRCVRWGWGGGGLRVSNKLPIAIHSCR